MFQKTCSRSRAQSNLVGWVTGALVLSVFLVIIFASNISDFFKHEEIKYCVIYSNTSGEWLDYESWVIMKIVSKDIDKINLTQFENLNTTYHCGDNLNKSYNDTFDHYYVTSYSMDSLCYNCNIKGYVCAEYLVHYYNATTQDIEIFESSMKWNKQESVENADNVLQGCKVIP